ncbi:hypothetical protein GQ43DRAFT_447308 [Delitschia confertaspora ATCC 74209]|uniref:DUF218 domain-containing protein n=1 Tax=Delitschia confertaspora ATCC 74209 TaxID=1513339 RepID=A0A9P4MV16_9PLEO|nr:hypothetical protein GQ43DRAFT_447308 [Delitschia confertaspora ATCC 74209]
MAPLTPSASLPKSRRPRSLAAAPSRVPTSASTAFRQAAVPERHDERHTEPEESGFYLPENRIPPPSFEGLKNLIIVCCHAVFHPSPSLASFPLYSPYEEQNWHLASFQQSNPGTGKPGEHETFLLHISTGLDTLAAGSWADNSLLVFSGGVTKGDLCSVSEARSYYHAALAQTFSQGHRNGGRVKTLFEKKRLLLEEYATDSFQNLLFSILLFRRTTGVYPEQIRVITHAFKSRRFLELHAPVIRWPSDRIRAVGIDPAMSSEEHHDTVRGEKMYGYEPWVQDPLGTGVVLDRKRRLRGWNEDSANRVCEGLEGNVKALVAGELVEPLPWEKRPQS